MKKKTNLTLSYIFFGIFLICTVYSAVSCSSEKHSENIYESMQSEPDTTVSGETSASETQESAETVNPVAELIPADKTVYFQSMWDTNTDIYAYIYIPNTNVDYPVLRHPDDNSYYLEHNIDKSKGLPGCIYTEDYNSIDFNDPVTLMYGHNMKNGSMFATLHNFEDAAFFNDNRYVFIYTPYKTCVYEVFAAVTYNDSHIMKSYDFTKSEDFDSFIDSIYSVRDMNAHYAEDITVSYEDNVLILSTCTASSSKRFLVCAVKLGELGE